MRRSFASITVTYTDSDLNYVSEATLNLYRWDEDGFGWIPLSTTLNTLTNQVTAATDELGLFSLRAEPLNPAPTLFSVSPSSFPSAAESEIVVTGENLLPIPWLNLGINALDVHYLSSSTLTATIPSLLATGGYTLTLRNPDGQMASLTNAFTINEAAVYLPVIVKD